MQRKGILAAAGFLAHALIVCDLLHSPLMHTHNNTGMETGTSAAAAGGSTTVIDMPLNSFPTTTTAEQLLKKMEIAEVCGVGVVGLDGWVTWLVGLARS